VRRILSLFFLAIVVVSFQIDSAFAVNGDFRAGEGLDEEGNSAVDVEAHDRYRAPGYSGTVGSSRRQSTECNRNADGQCQVAIQYSECIDEMNRGVTPTTAAITDPANTNTYTTVCGYSLPETRTVQYNPQDEADAIAWVRDYFSQTELPKPRPEISAPNGGICGVVHTIDLHMPVEVVHQEGTTPFGALDLHIYGRVRMDWGDGTRETYTTGGGPYPSVIKHSWTTRGYYDINAHATWSANYSLGPYNGYIYTGTLSGIATDGSINDFRVWEAQAMLVNE
jgi:hypothetical protein